MILAQHPLSAAFPAMPDDDFAALCADIKANGLIQPIVLFESQVIDGWHRYRACQAAGIEPRSSLLPAGSDPVAFVKSANGHRRHLTASQRAVAYAACDGSKWASVGRPRNSAPGARLPETASATAATLCDAAKEADVSKRTMTDAKAVVAKAIPEIAAAVRDGKISAKVGAKLSKLPKAEQAAALEKALQPKPKPKPKPKADKPETGKAKPASKKAEPEAPKADDHEVDNLRGAVEALAAENDELKQRVAVECMDATEDDKLAANDLITELRRQVKVLTAELEATRATRNQLMTTNAELVKSVAHWRRIAAKAEKAAA